MYEWERTMADTKKLIDEALSLPVEKRALIADCLLKSLNTPNSDIDRKWLEVAKRRIQELRSGKINPIPGNEVFDRINNRSAK
jgi:hypothetical protein